jgi:hypothetical protein
MALDSLSVFASSAVEAAPLPLRPRRAFPFCFDDDNILVPDDMLPPYLLAGLRRPLSIGTPPLIVGEADAGTTLVVLLLSQAKCGCAPCARKLPVLPPPPPCCPMKLHAPQQPQ